MLKSNAHGPAGLIDRKPPCKPSRLNTPHRAALPPVTESGPTPAIDGVVRCRIVDLRQWIYDAFKVSIAKQTLGRELRTMGYGKLSARPRDHAQAAGAVEAFKKSSLTFWTTSRDKGFSPEDIKIWFADRSRVGQKNKIIRRRAWPAAPKYQHTTSTYIFGAICPKYGKGAAPILRWCDPAAILAAIATTVALSAHVGLLLDQAGWHLSHQRVVPPNIKLLPLPPKCPELNRIEHVWHFMRYNRLSNRIFRSHEDILDHCSHAWERLITESWRVMSIGMREWVSGI